MKIFFQKLYFIFFSNDFQCFYWKNKKKAWHAQICLIIAPLPWTKKFLVFTRGGQLLGTPKILFLAKIPKYVFFTNFVVKYYFFFLIYFFTAEVSHFLGTKNSKTFFFQKKYFPKLFAQKYCFEFCVPKTWLSFAVKNKKNWGKIFLCKNNFEKYYF